jgi:hypothetical protein
MSDAATQISLGEVGRVLREVGALRRTLAELAATGAART